MATQQVFKFGNSTILVQNDDFGDGYSNGLVGNPDQEHPLTVEAIRNILVEGVTDTEHTQDWNTGYIVGVIRGIYEGVYKQKEEIRRPACSTRPYHPPLKSWAFS